MRVRRLAYTVAIFTLAAVLSLAMAVAAGFETETFAAEGFVIETEVPDLFLLRQGGEVGALVMASSLPHTSQADYGRTYIGPRPKPGEYGRTIRIDLATRWTKVPLRYHTFEIFW